ncbi:hypothetical protein QOZ95_004090 [Paenibacillus brasilensis]|uniref:Uncharacterized protein n=1 Tax=Paenibacillus brasilensis TaxID=128574 RepID=A0ABU0L3P9_9BACL|nr:hypothetical protein [Paenibacillus brasilensis]
MNAIYVNSANSEFHTRFVENRVWQAFGIRTGSDMMGNIDLMIYIRQLVWRITGWEKQKKRKPQQLGHLL